MRRQNCRQQNAVSASHVHEASPFAEIVCPSDDRANQCRHTCHRVVEESSGLDISLQIFEGFHPKQLGSGRESSLDAVQNFRKRSEKERAPPENKNGANRTWHTRAERVRKSSVCECSRRGFLEYILAGQEAENSVESRFVHVQFTGQVRGGLRAIFQQIGDSQFCCGVQSLVDDETVRHAQELQRYCGRCCGRRGLRRHNFPLAEWAQTVIEVARFFALAQVRAARYRYGPRLTISSVARTAAQKNPISGAT